MNICRTLQHSPIFFFVAVIDFMLKDWYQGLFRFHWVLLGATEPLSAAKGVVPDKDNQIAAINNMSLMKSYNPIINPLSNYRVLPQFTA